MVARSSCRASPKLVAPTFSGPKKWPKNGPKSGASVGRQRCNEPTGQKNGQKVKKKKFDTKYDYIIIIWYLRALKMCFNAAL